MFLILLVLILEIKNVSPFKLVGKSIAVSDAAVDKHVVNVVDCTFNVVAFRHFIR